MSETTRVLVADDEPLIRLLLRHAIGRQDRLELVGEAADGAEALALAGSLRPHILVLDVSMPAVDGLEVTRRLRAAQDPCGIVIFSSSSVAETAFNAGADHFVDKADGVDRVVAAVLALSDGPAREA
jgi:DNA-binding NarL/FixJ family response regulator